jgi:hypothetical protein
MYRVVVVVVAAGILVEDSRQGSPSQYSVQVLGGWIKGVKFKAASRIALVPCICCQGVGYQT